MIFNLLLGFAVARGAWHGLRGRTVVLRSYDGRRFKGGTFAYGDGRHDDGAFIQREINRGDTILHIPAGRFNVSRPIEIRNLGLHGSGAGTTAIRLETTP